MSDATIPATRTAPAARRGVGGGLHLALLLGFLAYVFIGTQPFGDPSAAQRVDGSSLDRIAVLGMFGLALAVLWVNRTAALALLGANLGLAAVVGFCLLSVVWSDYPALTIRRALLLVFLTVSAAAIAAGTTDLRRLHGVLFGTLTAVVLLNLVATAVAPGVAITDIGVRGIYSQKNVAGIVSMLAVVVAATWILGASRARSVAVGLAALLPALLFLVLTKSKTSIALTALALGIVAVFALAEWIGARFVLLVLGAGLLASALLLAIFAAFDFNPLLIVAAVTGDATFTGRDELWSFALNSALERPWLGHGYGAFWDVGEANDPLQRLDPGSWLGDVDIGTINQAHNGYLELWLHIGLPATILGVLVVARRGLTALRYVAAGSAGAAERAAVGMLGLILLLYLLHNFTEATLFMRGLAFCNIALLAMLLVSRAQAFSHLRNDRDGG
jgi:exopolysaccharide production protein ExoQ